MYSEETGSQEDQESHLKLHQYDHPEQFKMEDIDKYPNRLICYIKFKVISQNRTSIYGTGCLIDQKYVITAAHTIEGFAQAKSKMKSNFKMEGYIKQALHEGKMINQYRINQDSIRVSENYRTGKNKINNDYAIFQIEPFEGDIKKEEKYVPIVALKEGEVNNVKNISLYGYPYQVNKKEYAAEIKPSSVFMASAYGSHGKPTFFQPQKLSYQNPTDEGVSGGPIFTYQEELKEYIIIGIHKGESEKKKSNNKIEGENINDTTNIGSNFGVTSYQMLEEVNQWSFELVQRPFIFTKETFFMRNNPNIQKLDIFNLMDRNFDHLDMLVLSSFNLSHLKKLILGGNNLEEKGVKNLLKRPLQNLQSLFLSENHIKSLDSIRDEEWKNVSKLKVLSLSLNYLTSLPQNFTLLKSLEKLWLRYNSLKQIPFGISQLNSDGSELKRTVYLYENNLRKEDPEVVVVTDYLAKRKVTLDFRM